MELDDDGLLRHIERRDSKKARADFIRKLYVPKSKREQVLTDDNEGGAHAGESRLYLNLRELFWWPRMKIGVREWRQ